MSSESNHSDSSQLVDLVVEDKEANEIERVRARKEGGSGWNSTEQRHFVKTYPDEEVAEEVRQGFNPDRPETKITDETHNLDDPSDEPTAVADQEGIDEVGRKQPWEERSYDGIDEEREVWGGSK